ncbi:MAG: hypothetical protein JW955_26025 [Sedimentisphaerales bacterium]|nr:hypothetical protein [Sedimentisphaerales bacterium]
MSDTLQNSPDPKTLGVVGVLSLSALVVLLFAPAACAVEFAGGTGAPAAPYQIATAEQLVSIGDDPNLLDKYFILVADIDLDPNLPGGQVFTRAVIACGGSPYRGPHVAYTGRFYGNGHTIRRLTIDSAGMEYFGLFGTVGSTGRVYDLALEDVCVTSADRAGGLAGFNEGGLVNCSVTGRICGRERSSWLGGLAGVNEGTVMDCSAATVVIGGDYSLMLGALVGMHRGGVSNCSATGEVSGGHGSFYLGGLVGASTGGIVRDSHTTGCVLGGDASWALGALAGRADSNCEITNCCAAGSVTAGTGAHDLGGLLGSCYGADVTHCYATANVTGGDGSYSLGGLAGSCLATTVRDCYAAGDVCGFRTLGGFAGRVHAGTSITNCYAVGKVLRNGAPWGRGGFVALVDSSSDVHIARCFWDIETSGATTSAAGIGLTTAQMRDVATYQGAGWDLVGDRSDGTADLWVVPEAGSYPVLAALSDSCEPCVLKGAGSSFDPYLIATAEDLGAVRRYRRSAWYRLVADIDLSGVAWTAPPIPAFSGVFDGHGHQIRHLTLQGDDASRMGLFGRIEGDACVYNLGLEDVRIVMADGSHRAGGLAGDNAGYVVNCYVTGIASGGNNCRTIGGLIGVNWLGVISDCYAAVGVEAGDASVQVGGLVGYNYMGAIANCYAAGRVSGPDDDGSFGALVGRNSELAGTHNCYYLSASDGGGPDRGAGAAVTTGQLKQQSTFVDWDFEETWMLCEGETYPHLRWEGLTCGQ